MKHQRINKTISSHGICSRRKAEILINDKKVLVNGQIAEIGMKVNPEVDQIEVNGKLLNKNHLKSEILLFNKPKLVITSCSDNHNRKTIFDYLPAQYQKGFFPIGRLDFLSRGALLITNDGNICYRLSHPKFKHKKTYLVKINGGITDKSIDIWQYGVDLNGKKTFPCTVKRMEMTSKYTILKITMEEGRNRQIRRIASSLGFKVIDLQRISFGEIILGHLKEGAWRKINNIKLMKEL